MRIGIDARFFGPREKGLGVYVQKLVENLEKVSDEKEHQFFIFLRKERFEDFNPKKNNFHKVEANFSWYSWGEQIFYPFFLNKYKLDLMHFTHFNVPLLYWRKNIITIHDLILFHYPTFRNTTLSKIYYLIKLLAYKIVIKISTRKAKKIIAISNFTKKDLVRSLKIPEKKIEVVYQGCNLVFKKNKKNTDDILEKYGIIKPYLLYVGNAYPHKNLERLIEVFQDFRKKYPRINLVLTGGKDYFYQCLEKETNLKKRQGVIFSGFVEEKDLRTVYKQSELVVFPSLYEGFGFPPLEALLNGKPVACSDRTSMIEILKEKVEYFDPENSEEMFECLEKVYKNRKKGIKLDLKKIKEKFNWLKTAKKTLKIYNSVAKSK